MVPHPHLAPVARLRQGGGVGVAGRIRPGSVGAGGTAEPLDGDGPWRRSESARLAAPAPRSSVGSIVGSEAVVVLAIVFTQTRGAVGVWSSTWALAGLSVLFFILSRLRRRASASGAGGCRRN